MLELQSAGDEEYDRSPDYARQLCIAGPADSLLKSNLSLNPKIDVHPRVTAVLLCHTMCRAHVTVGDSEA